MCFQQLCVLYAVQSRGSKYSSTNEQGGLPLEVGAVTKQS